MQDLNFLTTPLGALLQSMAAELSEAGIEDALRESQSLLCLGTSWDVLELLRRQEQVLSEEQARCVRSMFQRRLSREPMAYIIGRREFYGRDFSVGSGVLIPRPETEHLIEWVVEEHQKSSYELGLDLCAGPGTIGLTLAMELKRSMDLVEWSESALNFASQNIQAFGLGDEVNLFHMDVTEPMDLGKYDLIVSNPPYVPAEDMPDLMVDVKDHEPHMALDGGPGGLEFLEKMMPRLSSLAAPGCHLYLELGLGHEEALRDRKFDGWGDQQWRHDLARIPRIVRYTFKPD